LFINSWKWESGRERVVDIYQKLYAGVNNPIGGVPADRGTGPALKSRVEGELKAPYFILYGTHQPQETRYDGQDQDMKIYTLAITTYTRFPVLEESI
jgi:hypothetical protein